MLLDVTKLGVFNSPALIADCKYFCFSVNFYIMYFEAMLFKDVYVYIFIY